jgi:hypothetical protein
MALANCLVDHGESEGIHCGVIFATVVFIWLNFGRFFAEGGVPI